MTGILSLITFAPALGAALLLALRAGRPASVGGDGTARWIALVATLVNFALGIVLWANFDVGGAQWQFIERADVFAGFAYALGIDGIALISYRFCFNLKIRKCEGILGKQSVDSQKCEESKCADNGEKCCKVLMSSAST